MSHKKNKTNEELRPTEQSTEDDAEKEITRMQGIVQGAAAAAAKVIEQAGARVEQAGEAVGEAALDVGVRIEEVGHKMKAAGKKLSSSHSSR
jgi:hypothetical protein